MINNINEYKNKKAMREEELYPDDKVNEALGIIKNSDVKIWLAVMAGKSDAMSLTDAMTAHSRYVKATEYIASYRKFLKKYKKATMEEMLSDARSE